MAQKTRKSAAKISIFLIIIILSTYIVQGSAQGISPALQKLSELFPDKPYSSITLFNTMVSLVSILTNLAAAAIVKKLGYKWTAVLGTTVYLLGGWLPFFKYDSYAFIFGCRVLMGLGYGILFPLGGSLCSVFIEDEKFRGRLMGWGSIVSQGTVMLFSSVGGILTDIGVRYNFCISLIMLIPLALAFFIPEAKAKAAIDQSVENAEKSKEAKLEQPGEQEKINGVGWFSIFAYAFIVLFIYAFYLYTSKIVAVKELGSATQAGLVVSLMACGGMTAGICYPLAPKYLKNRTLPFSFTGMAVFFFVMSQAESIIVMYLGAYLLGFTYSFSMVFTFMGVSLNVPKSKAALGFGIQMAAKNVTAFLASYFFVFVAKIFGQSMDTNPSFAYIFTSIVCAIAAIIFYIKPVDILGLKKK